MMIFEDPTRIRWKVAIIFLGISAALSAFVGADYTIGSSLTPPLPSLASSRGFGGPLEIVDLDASENAPAIDTPGATGPATAGAKADLRKTDPLSDRQSSEALVRTAFVVQDDSRSVTSLRNNIGQLDIVFPDYYSTSDEEGQLNELIDPAVASLLASKKACVYPRLSNTDSAGAWHGEELSSLLRNDDASHTLIDNLVRCLQQCHAQGLNVDFEELSANDRVPYVNWLEDLATALHRNHLRLTVDLPMNEQGYDYEAIGELVDAVVVMGYDEHFAGGARGPVASQEWFTDGISDMLNRIPARKLIVAVGAYGYDWDLASKRPAEALDFVSLMNLAQEAGATVETEKVAVNGTFNYKDHNGHRHEVWFLDAVSAWNEYSFAKSQHCRGISLWRMGMEEPALWNFFGGANFNPEDLEAVKPGASVLLKGEGEFPQVMHAPKDGTRIISLDDQQVIDFASYTTLPSYFVVERHGATQKKQVALTFDDGPDGVWTPQILKVLRDNAVSATFFLVGDQARRFPDIVKDEVDQGHLVGNHTFNHPDVRKLSREQLETELNSTQRLVESLTGHQTLLFRSPYSCNTTPTAGDELAVLHTAKQLGYVTVGADIDSADYERPGVEKIVQNVMTAIAKGQAHVVVMHDAGGNREQTVAALAELIPALKKQGYQFVTVNELIGVGRKVVMPRMPTSEETLAFSGHALTYLRVRGWQVISALFYITTAIAILRILFLGVFVLRSEKHRAKAAAGFTPPVLVLVPAYNEGKVIRRTLLAVLESDYPDFSILVVDDGSSDDTADRVRELAAIYPQIELVSKPNGGKFSALNLGFRRAAQEYVVTIDADTLVTPQTLRQLIAPFAAGNVDAVCGNVQVGNVKNVLTAFQDIEYVTSQNYDRRAFDSLNCIAVVPGATGAWRRDAVLEAGGYSHETLTEDADLTLTMLSRRARIVYAPLAKSITEAPENARGLFRQRARWSFGTFQCLWKHRRNFGKGALGWVAMPNILLFQVIFPLLAPIGDVVFLLSLCRGDFGAIATGYLIFLGLDLAGSLVAFRLDRRSMRSLWAVLIQRFYYRQFMYVVMLRSMAGAVIGKRHGWNKLDRNASVRAAEPDMSLAK